MSEMIRGPIKHIAVTPQTETFKPYLHQEKAMSQMTKHFLEKKRAAGIVVIPTGGGKTTLASRWLLQNCIAKGQRVLWLAHRSNLLAQALQRLCKTRAPCRSPKKAEHDYSCGRGQTLVRG